MHVQLGDADAQAHVPRVQARLGPRARLSQHRPSYALALRQIPLAPVRSAVPRLL
jgi:hypothetical protein